MRRLAPILLLAAAACAAPRAAGPASSDPVSTRSGVLEAEPEVRAGSEIRVAADQVTVRTAVAAPTAQAFAALTTVYEELGIPVTRTNPGSFAVGNPAWAAVRRIGGEPMTTYFNCGMDGQGRPMAASYRLRINIQSALVPGGSGSELQTLVGATAQSQATNADPVVCTSTGRLEARIANSVLLKLAT